MNKAQKAALPIARVQIPPYMTLWIRGDKYGDVVRVSNTAVKIAHVKMDISRKTVKVILADCTEVD